MTDTLAAALEAAAIAAEALEARVAALEAGEPEPPEPPDGEKTITDVTKTADANGQVMRFATNFDADEYGRRGGGQPAEWIGPVANPRQHELTRLDAGVSITLVARPADGSAEVTRLDTTGTGGPTVPPPSSGDWTDEAGVCCHLQYSGTANGASPQVRDILLDLGVVHIRDGWGTGSPGPDEFVRDFPGRRLQLTFVCDPRDGNDPAARVEHLRKLAGWGVLDTIELCNEWGGWDGDPNVTYNGWQLRPWCEDIINRVRTDSAFDDVMLGAPSMADTGTTSKYERVGFIDGLDYGVTHDYPGGTPQGGKPMDTWISEIGQSNARIIAGAGKPVIATETGFTTKGDSFPISEQQQAEWTPELYEIHRATGMRRTFNYVLVEKDEDGHEGGFGLLRKDHTPKPVYAAFKSMLASARR